MLKPTLLGTEFVNEDGESGMITDEREDQIFLEMPSFTGWTSKELFLSLIEAE